MNSPLTLILVLVVFGVSFALGVREAEIGVSPGGRCEKQKPLRPWPGLRLARSVCVLVVVLSL
jgi:hypothetical protein